MNPKFNKVLVHFWSLVKNFNRVLVYLWNIVTIRSPKE